MSGIRRRSLVALVLSLVAVVGLLAPRAQVGATELTIDPAAIDRYVESERAAAGIPGVALGIVRGGQVAYLKGYGTADATGRGVTPQTPFMLGSVSKSFTALATLQLAEAGKLDLDAPVKRYLPWFRVGDATASDRITVRQLLSHTSGISRYDGEVAFVADHTASLDSIVRGMAGLSLNRPVGASHEYSNLNYEVLGAVVEAVSGQSYGDYVKARIFQPLGMRHSFVTLSEAQGDGISEGYSYRFGVVVPSGNPYHAGNLPSGYLISSAEDMARYLTMWLGEGGPAVLSRSGLAELQRPAVPTVPRGYTHYAMGWYTNPEGSVVWHGGSTLNHHASVKILQPTEKQPEPLGFVVLYNMTDDVLVATSGQGFGLVDGVISLVYGERPRPAGTPHPVQVLYVLDLVGLLALVAVGAGWVRLLRGRARPALGGWHALASAAATMLCLLVALGILLGVQRGVSWTVVLASIPDYGYLVIFGCVGLLALGVARAGLLFRGLGGYK